MILDGSSCAKPKIEYPCEWGYKLIGRDRMALEACIFDIMGERDYHLKRGNSSSRGRFHALNMKCMVESQEDRDRIFKAFSEHPDVQMVI